jgi:hypothetical protein
MDLKEVLGWDAENLDQRILNRLRHFPETGVVILTFEHVDFCERQVLVSLSKYGGSRVLERRQQPRSQPMSVGQTLLRPGDLLMMERMP